MFITRKTYDDLIANNNNLKRMNLSLMQEKNELYKQNFEMAKELEEFKNKKTRKSTTKKETTETTEKKTTRKPRTKKEE